MPIHGIGAAALVFCFLWPHLASAQARSAPADSQGKIVAMHGRVEHAQATQDVWRRAEVFRPLYVAERVRTLAASRAAILFIDETQVKLNAGAVLRVRETRVSGGGRTIFDLQLGEGWFRTKNPASGLTIQTPAAAATIRGSEINVRVQPDQQTVLTVVEGTVEFANAAGSLLVLAGEEATAAPGQAPTKRIILNPEDAVQWALYYPVARAWRELPDATRSGPAAAGFERLRAGDAVAALQVFESNLASDPWARIGASMARVDLGDLQQARSVLDQPAGGRAAEIERRAQLAAVALVMGDAATARAEIEAVLGQDPTAVRPLTLLSSLELTQNRRTEAEAAARAALGAHPTSVAAHVAASEAAQSRFDLAAAEGYVDRALAIDPTDLRALVNRARVRFGSGHMRGARADADQAATLAPNEAQVRSLRGFIRLADGDVAGAQADFDVAAQEDLELAEPHLGLGLLHFRRQAVAQGLLEMLTATLLEPKVSLYQSYLGKAYSQAGRFAEGLGALETAKRLDPRDPTPWLYASFVLRDRNRQVDALAELQQAIARNDNRAVYRSRLLLDRDLATKNVSLVEVYRQLGFEAWGAFEAQNSLDADYTNASAHLFLSDTYIQLPDRLQAASGELLQYFLHAPVNRNAFHTFNEYTALLEQPWRQLSLSTETGTMRRAFGDTVSRSGNERFAHNAFVQIWREDGARRDNSDDRVQAFFQGKVAFDASSDMFFSVTRARSERGADPDVTVPFGGLTDAPILLRVFRERDPNISNELNLVEDNVGFKRAWRPGSTLTATAAVRQIDVVEENARRTTSACGGDLSILFFFLPLTSRSTLTDQLRSASFQAQQVTQIGRHQVVAGTQVFRERKAHGCREDALLDGEELFELENAATVHDRSFSFYVRDEIEIRRWLHASVGARYEQLRYADPIGDGVFDLGRWNPLAGLALWISPRTVVRLASFNSLNTDFVGARISPPTVSGFAIERNEFPTSRRHETNLSIETSRPRAFIGLRAFVRDTEVPLLLRPPLLVPEADSTTTGGGAYVNWIWHPRVSFFADDLLARISTPAFRRVDNRVRLGINVIHERGVFGRLTTSYLTQRFDRTRVPALPESSFVLVDVELGYEFASKRGLITLSANNLFDERFVSAIEGLSTSPIRPERRALLRFRWRL